MRRNYGNFTRLGLQSLTANKASSRKNRAYSVSVVSVSADSRYHASKFCLAIARTVVISKSDLVILVLASGALAFGVYRWHQNTQDVNAITIPASNRVATEPAHKTVVAGGTRVIEGPANLIKTPGNSIESQGSNQVVVQTLPNPTPVAEIVVNETVSSSSATGSIQLGTHLVRSGDYLGKIAQQYGTDVNTLRDLNGISGTVIHVGQELFYPL